jgi:glucans biosynthesis protein
MLNRRQFLHIATATAGLAASGFAAPALAQGGLTMGASEPFSFDALKKRARDMAGAAYVAPHRPSPEVLHQIDYDAHGKIRFKTDLALWANGPSEFPVTFFHMGRFFQRPCACMYRGGPGPRDRLRQRLLRHAGGFAGPSAAGQFGLCGFRFQEARTGKLDWRKNDWVAFLGASYFRAIGELYQYGLSARGLAVDVAVFGRNEEFPDFTHVYFETPQPGLEHGHGLRSLDGPSVSGAYRFVMQRAAAIIMDVESAVYLRQDVSRLGLAPLTSMYWYSEKAKITAIDWRPEIHDSDGLALWTGAASASGVPSTTRPASSPRPSRTRTRRASACSSATATSTITSTASITTAALALDRAAGLLGPGLDPAGGNPYDDEIHDNIVAMWVPAEPARAGQALELRYRMHWSAEEPYPTPLARVIATRFGNGGQAGTNRPRGVRKFMVEFIGQPLTRLPSGVIPRPVLSASRVSSRTSSRGRAQQRARPLAHPVRPNRHGTEPVEMRCYLRNENEVLSETWLYQYHPTF